MKGACFFITSVCRPKVGPGFGNSAVAGGQAKAQTKNLVAGGQAKAPSKNETQNKETRAWL